jgi:hypothetical protein
MALLHWRNWYVAQSLSETFMTIANCPRCREQVTVPECANPEATVRCPLCQDEFPLAEALRELPPALIVLNDGDETSSPVAATEETPWPAFDLDADDADEVSLAPAEGVSPAAPFDFTSGSATGSSATGGSTSTATIRPSSRTRKPKGSPIKSILSIVIGGMMAFPIAQLILWYLPGDLKRDFGAGPVVAQYVPQIVPMKFRGDAASNDSEPETVLPEIESEFSFNGNNEFSNAISNTPASNRQAQTELEPTPEDSQANEPMSLDDDAAAAGDDVLGSRADNVVLRHGDRLVVEEPKLELLPLREPKITIEPPNVDGLATGAARTSPQFAAADVAKCVQSAISGNEAWDADDASSPSNQVRLQFYSSLSSLGEALTFADQSSDGIKEQMKATSKLLEQIAKQSAKVETIGAVANKWISLGRERRGTNGICLHGVVKSVAANGELFETVVESNGQEIGVVSMLDPSDFLIVGREVLILGAILDDPAKDLGGYKGDRSVVVLDGYHMSVSSE